MPGVNTPAAHALLRDTAFGSGTRSVAAGDARLAAGTRRWQRGLERRQTPFVMLAIDKLIGHRELAAASEAIGRLVAGRIDVNSIAAACTLASFDVGYRKTPALYNPDAPSIPDAITTDHIATMVERTLSFFRTCGPITRDGFTFDGGYTDLVTAGDGDFLTADTLWDLKVSVSGPKKEHTLQILMYLLMGLRSGQPAFRSITHLGVFNPRLNAAYRIALDDIPPEVLPTVSQDVIGY